MPMDRKNRKWNLVLLFGSLALTLLGLEVATRLAVGFHPGYYVGLSGSKSSRTIVYPYGKIIFNSAGYPDGEFLAQKEKPRVAYIGDSVCYGVGAGYGHRLSEVLEKEFGGYEHMNLAFGLGQSLNEANMAAILRAVRDYKIDKVVYLFNLNDIIPNSLSDRGSSGVFNKKVLDVFNYFRGRSYLFSFLVYRVISSTMIRNGWFSTGDKVIKVSELQPARIEETVAELTARIKSFSSALEKEGAGLITVVLPYEMQISEEAERVYRELGVKWGDGFIERGTQKVVESRLQGLGLDYVDAYYAFVDPDNEAESRKKNGLGRFFVYNRGDRLDWNHPNREGHRRIAEFLKIQLQEKRFLN